MSEADGTRVQRARRRESAAIQGSVSAKPGWTGGAVGQEPRLQTQAGARLLGGLSATVEQ